MDHLVLVCIGQVLEHVEVYSSLFGRVANDSRPGRLIDSKIMVELKILGVILCHDHAVVVGCAKNRLESIVANNRVKKSGRDHDH